MPAPRKLFEGPSLEPLLEQINRELGPQAKIVRAEKTRQGGVMGFFAREQFRLTVQVPPPARKPARNPKGAGGAAAGSPSEGHDHPGGHPPGGASTEAGRHAGDSQTANRRQADRVTGQGGGDGAASGRPAGGQGSGRRATPAAGADRPLTRAEPGSQRQARATGRAPGARSTRRGALDEHGAAGERLAATAARSRRDGPSVGGSTTPGTAATTPGTTATTPGTTRPGTVAATPGTTMPGTTAATAGTTAPGTAAATAGTTTAFGAFDAFAAMADAMDDVLELDDRTSPSPSTGAARPRPYPGRTAAPAALPRGGRQAGAGDVDADRSQAGADILDAELVDDDLDDDDLDDDALHHHAPHHQAPHHDALQHDEPDHHALDHHAPTDPAMVDEATDDLVLAEAILAHDQALNEAAVIGGLPTLNDDDLLGGLAAFLADEKRGGDLGSTLIDAELDRALDAILTGSGDLGPTLTATVWDDAARRRLDDVGRAHRDDRRAASGPEPQTGGRAGGQTEEDEVALLQAIADSPFSDSFDEVLRRVAMVLDDDPYPSEPYAVTVDPVDEPAPSPVKQRSEGTAAHGPADDDNRASAPLATAHPAEARPTDPDDEPSAAHVPTHPASAPPARRPRHARSDDTWSAGAVRAQPGLARRGAHLARADTDPSVLTPGALGAQAVLMADRLLAAGLPAADVDRVVGALADGRRFSDLLVDLFSRLPAPPPLPHGPGTVVAVTGHLPHALDTARDVAVDIGADPAQVVLLGARRPFLSPTVGSLAAAPQHQDEPTTLATTETPARPTAGAAPGPDPTAVVDARTDVLVAQVARRRRSVPVVVVVESGFGGAQRTWAAHTLARLRPSAVWGVVEAVAKPEDVAAWATGLGGLDALVVDDLAATVSPAAVLRTGVPVARLDGQPATPERWAAAVGDLVAA